MMAFLGASSFSYPLGPPVVDLLGASAQRRARSPLGLSNLFLSVPPMNRYNVPVRIKNSYNPGHPGTLISAVAARRWHRLAVEISNR